ncbi:hypothetical protein LT85_2135 [Collimonas arenae]|uniref:Uncharacterized protein n=1 Tax=Collimonas arenae TaxID=279058 RepID=A0A0A1F997_9BURK|nr:hypothetical protein LT85_2135 [Collimonas arenae]
MLSWRELYLLLPGVLLHCQKKGVKKAGKTRLFCLQQMLQ